MTTSWPPTPSVEDEEAALANEYALDSIASSVQSKEEPQAKGTVDQYPIILDAQSSRNESAAIESDREHSSSDESHGPPTPTTANSEQRFVLLEHDTPKKIPPQADWQPPRSEDRVRGRPYVSPIQTNVGNDLDEMITGHRRLPSPYASGSKQPSSGSQPQKRFSGDSFLSPQHASSDEHHRARSTGRKGKHEDARSLTDPEKSSEKRRHHSRRRRESGIKTTAPSLEDLASTGFDRRSLSYTAAAAAPVASILSSGIHNQSKEDCTVAEAAKHRRALRDSPYTSAAEEKSRRHRSKSRRRSKSRARMDRTITQTSPYTSSAEESKHSTHRAYKIPASDRKLSRRSSTIKAERPRLNVSDQYYSYGVGDPLTDHPESSKRQSDSHRNPAYDGRSHLVESSSVQSPEAMEDYLAKAFKANWRRSDRTPLASPDASPFVTPPRSPPQTPRRNRGSKGSFDHISETVLDAPRSRQASGDDSPWNGLRPLTTAAAGMVASRMIPPLSRSSTAPIDATSHSSSSKPPSSGPRSRRPSPVHEDFPRPVSRAGSFDVRDDRPLSRVATSASSEQRRYPRLPVVITQAPVSMDHTSTSRVSHGGVEAPRPITRSYSTVPEEMARPHPAYRAMSTSQVLPSPTTEQWRPSPVYRSSSST
jgi:hypothetical protein